MGLLTKEVEVGLKSSTIKYYEELGYEIPRRKDKWQRVSVKKGTKIKVKVKDLTDGSNALVNVQCDKCSEILENIKWEDYKKRIKGNKYFCPRCSKNGYNKWISFYDWCYENLPEEEADNIMARWDYEKNIKNGEVLSPKEVSYRSHGINGKGYWFKCLGHHNHISEQKDIHNFTIGEKSLNCNQCRVVSTTNPEVIKYLVNIEDASSYTIGSKKKIPMKCPDCGYKKELSLDTLKRSGFGCPKCSDGVSYPNKIMFNILEQLQDLGTIQSFETEKTFDWLTYKFKDKLRNGRIDFYFKIYGKRYGIEMDGKFHITNNKMNGQTKEESKYIDDEKDRLGKEHGFEILRIDCSESKIEYIKNNIMQSELPTLLNFEEDDINWLHCHEFACNSLVKVVCDMWNNEIKNTLEIGNKLKIHRGTVTRYLKQGVELGWCDYDPKEESNKNYDLMKTKMSIKVICLTTGEVFNSINEASNKYKIDNSSISKCCRGVNKHAGKHPIIGEPLRWMYYDEYIKQQNIS